jgi:hypothetical protein
LGAGGPSRQAQGDGLNSLVSRPVCAHTRQVVRCGTQSWKLNCKFLIHMCASVLTSSSVVSHSLRSPSASPVAFLVCCNGRVVPNFALSTKRHLHCAWIEVAGMRAFMEQWSASARDTPVCTAQRSLGIICVICFDAIRAIVCAAPYQTVRGRVVCARPYAAHRRALSLSAASG